MMRKNVRKAVLSSVKVVVCILFLVQSAQSETISKTSKYTTLSVVEVKNEMAFETKKDILSDTLSAVKSIKKISDATKQVQLVGDESVLDTDKKLKTLSEKTDRLNEKVKILLERVEAILGKVKAEAPSQEVELIQVEELPNSDNEMKTLLDEDLAFKYPSHVVAGGISTCKDWTGSGLQGSYAYRLNNYFSLGLQVNASFNDGKYSGDRSLYAGVRANFHILPLLVKSSNFDLYAGGTLGAGFDHDDMTLEGMGYMGVSYDFSKSLGVFAEAGNIGVLGLRFKF
ncbi:hypothetical protein ACXR6G_02215 [Ancylomarina sp. YFZ004]